MLVRGSRSSIGWQDEPKRSASHWSGTLPMERRWLVWQPTRWHSMAGGWSRHSEFSLVCYLAGMARLLCLGECRRLRVLDSSNGDRTIQSNPASHSGSWIGRFGSMVLIGSVSARSRFVDEGHDTNGVFCVAHFPLNDGIVLLARTQRNAPPDVDFPLVAARSPFGALQSASILRRQKPFQLA